MNELQYTYLDSSQVLSYITGIKDFTLLEFIILIWLVIGVIVFVFYIIPIFYILVDDRKNEKEKRRKKSLLEQIMLQKEIENEIENEIKEQEERLLREKKETL